jgi:hypothetical protein
MLMECMRHEMKGVSNTNDIIAKNEASKASKKHIET